MAEKQVSINDFLRKRELKTKEIHFDGMQSPFIIGEITNDVNEKLRKQATRQKKNPRTGQIEQNTDQNYYTDLLLVASVKQPDLNNADIQKYYGTMGDASETLKTMLSFSEYNKLALAVNEISGVTETLDDEVSDVKK